MGESVRKNIHENSLHMLRNKDTPSHKGNASLLPALFTEQCQRSDFNPNVNLEPQERDKRCT